MEVSAVLLYKIIYTLTAYEEDYFSPYHQIHPTKNI